MSIIKVRKRTAFFVASNAFALDAGLSLKAKGLLTVMLCKPDDWQFFVKQLVTHSSDGLEAHRNALKELEGARYVVKGKRHAESGRILEWDWLVNDEPILDPDTALREHGLSPVNGKASHRQTRDSSELETIEISVTDGRFDSRLNNGQYGKASDGFSQSQAKPVTGKPVTTKGYIQATKEDDTKGSVISFVDTQEITEPAPQISANDFAWQTGNGEPSSGRPLTAFAVRASAVTLDGEGSQHARRLTQPAVTRPNRPAPSVDSAPRPAPASNRRTARPAKPAPEPRPRDPYFDAVAIACYGSLEGLLKDNSSWVAKAANQLKAINATLEQIEAFPIWARDRFKPDGVSILITPTIFTKHWPSFLAEYVPQYRPTEKRKRTLAEREAEYG